MQVILTANEKQAIRVAVGLQLEFEDWDFGWEPNGVGWRVVLKNRQGASSSVKVLSPVPVEQELVRMQCFAVGFYKALRTHCSC